VLLAAAGAGCGGNGGGGGEDTPFSFADNAAPVDAVGPGEDLDVSDQAAPDGQPRELPPKQCQFGVECEDGNPCTQDLCGASGLCEHPPLQAPCDDADPCTSGDACLNGTCQGSPLPCDDGNDCTADTCKQGACSHKPSPDPGCDLDVILTKPVLGAQLQGSGAVPVAGQVLSPAGAIASLTVAGQAVAPGPGGKFELSVQPTAGITIVEALAKDEFGRAAKAERAFVTAGKYHAAGSLASPTLIAAKGGAAQAWLRWDVFDDDDQNDLDDLATLAWLVLSTLDIDSLIPHPLAAEGDGPGFAWCEWVVDVTDVTYSVDELELVPITGGMYLTATITNFSAYVSAVADWCPDGLGWIYADELILEATILGTASGGCQVKLDLVDSNVEIIGLSVDMTGGFASLFDWLINWFSEELAAKIEQELETWFAQEFVEQVDAMLSDLTDYTMQFQIPGLPGNPPGNPTALRICASDLAFTKEGGGAGSSGGVGTDCALNHGSPGSMARQGCSLATGLPQPPAVDLPNVDQIEAAIAEDVLNQVLFALWWGGHMSISLDADLLGLPLEDYGLDGGNVETDPNLPPVLTTCTKDGKPEVQIGDLHMDVTLAGDLMSGSVELLASVRVGVKPVLVPGDDGKNMISLEILGVRQIAAEVLGAQGDLVGSEELIESLVSVVLVDMLIGQLLSEALGAYPIPDVDLSNYITFLPPGSVVSFDPQTAEFDDGYLVLGGDLVAP
jgi:hypothetical protein